MNNSSKSRIYGDKADIDENSVKQFWNNRASRYDEANPYVTVKLGDRQPERAKQWDEYEKSTILPLLKITSNDYVLDIGCGIGRLAEAIIPICKYYLGTDCAEDLIELAKKRFDNPGCDYDFVPMAIQDIAKGSSAFPKSDVAFSVLIIAGTLPYLNDDTVLKSLHNITSVMAKSCRIYIGTAIGTTQRLTLDNFSSEELSADYSIIYRTEDEHLKLYKPLFDVGFHVATRGGISANTANTAETQRIFHILER